MNLEINSKIFPSKKARELNFYFTRRGIEESEPLTGLARSDKLKM